MTPQIRQYLKGGEQLPVGDKTPRWFLEYVEASSADAIDDFSLFLATRLVTISPLFPSKSEHSCRASRM